MASGPSVSKAPMRSSVHFKLGSSSPYNPLTFLFDSKNVSKFVGRSSGIERDRARGMAGEQTSAGHAVGLVESFRPGCLSIRQFGSILIRRSTRKSNAGKRHSSTYRVRFEMHMMTTEGPTSSTARHVDIYFYTMLQPDFFFNWPYKYAAFN